MAEAFDQDPFLLFRLRGIERDRFLKMLGVPVRTSGADEDGDEDKIIPEPLSMSIDDFWGRKNQVYDRVDAASPKFPAVLPRRLGSIAFWRGRDDFLSVMDRLYRNASQNGMAVYSGDKAL